MELHEMTDKAVDYIFANLDIDDRRLSPKDRQFIESASDQWERKRWLSDPQKKWLGDVWEKV